jgi:A/G-specific adenine glycosylase
LSKVETSGFAHRLIAWQRVHGRHDLPWQGTRDPYRIWLAEVMLQQTQVATVIPYYLRFVEAFPDIHSLAGAHIDRVLELWSGLGYYSRARNLHRAAQLIEADWGGRFPQEFEPALALPGIGRSTAGAILAAAFGQRHAIVDGNVKRVLARHFAVEGFPGTAAVERVLWDLAESLLPMHDVARYHQALMDLGATLCTRRAPRCASCPVAATCLALANGRIEELPARRPRRARPLRRQAVAMVCTGDAVLLEKRPPQGIWGGLWSLPEIGSTLAAAENYVAPLGLEVIHIEALPPFRHGFTHFELELQPVLMRVARAGTLVAEHSAHWFEFSALASLGLPAPVRRLLQRLVSA